MLSPEDVAQTVWESVNKPSNVYIEDVMIKDEFQNMKIWNSVYINFVSAILPFPYLSLDLKNFQQSYLIKQLAFSSEVWI